jgi:hypothetical protein
LMGKSTPEVKSFDLMIMQAALEAVHRI